MNCTEIKEYAIVKIENDIDIVYAIRYINEAIQKISARFKKSSGVSATTQIVCDDINVEYELPTTRLLQISRVYYIDLDNDLDYRQYSINGNKLKFSDKGTFRVKYLRRSDNCINESESPEVNELYHIPISLYVAAQELLRERKFTDQAQSLLNEFEQDCAIVHNSLTTNTKQRLGVIKARKWRWLDV